MKVAIYSGTLPSTPFIEQLIEGLAIEGETIHLFGTRLAVVNYATKNCHLYTTPKSRYILPFFVLVQGVMLSFCHLKRFFLLCNYLKGKDKKWRLLGKYLPVLNHLPDVFHVQWAKSAEEWLFLKELFGVKLVLSLRGAHINYSPICDALLAQSYARVFPQYDAFHAVSAAILMGGEQYGISRAKSDVIYPAVQPLLLKAIKPRPMHNPVRILSVGRDHWKKGYTYALDACSQWTKDHMNFQYTIIAGGEKEELRYQIQDLGITQYVILLDKLPHKDVLDRMRESDLVLLPSVEEGVANVVLEAMAVGCPVISTNCGGMAEVIEDGYNGWLVPIRDAKALAEAVTIVTKMSDEELYKLRVNAQQTIKEKHLLPQQIAAMKSLYRNV